MGGFNQNHNQSSSKGTGASSVFCKRKPAFKIRIDSFKTRGIPTSSASNNTNSKPKKSVRIAENRNTVLFRHVLESELKQTWYETKDYCHFQQDSKTTLNALHNVQGQLCRLNAEQHCIRGLEAHISPCMLQLRKTRIRSNVQVVLDQQRVQRYHGVRDPNMVASVSRMFSKQSRQNALSMGALDTTLRGY